MFRSRVTVIIRVNAAAFIKFLALKMRRLFEDGVYCKPCNNCEFIALPKVTDKRKGEIGLVVSERFSAVTMELRIAEVLERRLSSKAMKYIHFELYNTTIEKNNLHYWFRLNVAFCF